MISAKTCPVTSRLFHAGLRIGARKASVSSLDQPEHLKRVVLQKLRATGAITVAQFMKEVLINPACGYYTTREMLGRSGDFVTSPEISQMFGEIIAVWFVNEWAKVGSPKPFNLIELGPGRASMMMDILRTFDQLQLQSLVNVHLVEISDSLSKLQAERLCVNVQHHDLNSSFYMSGETKSGVKVFWYKTVQHIDMTRFSLVVAHEFFDALPVHKFQKTPRGWREVMIDVDYDDSSGQKLKYVLSPGPSIMSTALISETETRDHVEVSPESILIMEYLADQLERYGGIALVIDYGHNGDKTDTFRAYRNHQQCDPLMNIGSTDLTADVDFAVLKKAVGNKLISFGPVTQRQFLQQMQMDIRLQMLLKNCNDEKQKEILRNYVKMLMDEDKMGCSFFFVAFFPAVLEKLLQRIPSVGFLAP